MTIASRGATMAVDWEQRVDFPRLRLERMERAKAALAASDLGALLLFDPNNIRYVTSSHIGEWARDKNARFVLLCRDSDPILWDFGSAARHHQLYAPWLPESSWRAGVTQHARRDAGGDRRPGRDGGEDRPRARRARAAGRAGRHRHVRHGHAAGAAPRRRRDHRRAAGDALGAEDQDRGRAGAARPRGGDRRRGLRADLRAAAARACASTRSSPRR